MNRVLSVIIFSLLTVSSAFAQTTRPSRISIINDPLNGWSPVSVGVPMGVSNGGSINGVMSTKLGWQQFYLYDGCEGTPTPAQLLKMRDDLRAAHEQGALAGVYGANLDAAAYQFLAPYITHNVAAYYFGASGPMTPDDYLAVTDRIVGAYNLDHSKPIAFVWRARSNSGDADTTAKKRRPLPIPFAAGAIAADRPPYSVG